MELKKREIIFLLPHLNEKTTSSERFISIIDCFLKVDEVLVNVVCFQYPIKRALSYGHQLGDINISEDIKENLQYLLPPLNFIQRISFLLFNNGFIKVWKVLGYIYQAILGTDIFTPGKLALNQIRTKSDNGLIIAFGGPFSIFLFAKQLSVKTNYPLVLDYRDPWNFGYTSLNSIKIIQYLKRFLIKQKEIELLKKSILIFTVSETLKKYFPEKFHHKIFVIENGSNFENVEVRNNNFETFEILYLGTIYDEQLIDESFFIAVKNFVNNKVDVKFNFIGSKSNNKLEKIIEKYDLTKHTRITERLESEKVLDYLQSASLFLHLRYSDKNGIITSKQADYLAFRKPILLPISDHGDLKESIEINNAGIVCNSISEIEITLKKQYELYTKNISVIIVDNIVNKENSRTNLAANFYKIVNNHLSY
jgi:hypothetical protein